MHMTHTCLKINKMIFTCGLFTKATIFYQMCYYIDKRSPREQQGFKGNFCQADVKYFKT